MKEFKLRLVVSATVKTGTECYGNGRIWCKVIPKLAHKTVEWAGDHVRSKKKAKVISQFYCVPEICQLPPNQKGQLVYVGHWARFRLESTNVSDSTYTW